MWYATKSVCIQEREFLFVMSIRNSWTTNSSRVSRRNDFFESAASDSRKLLRTESLSVSYEEESLMRSSSIADSKYSGYTQNLRLTGRTASVVAGTVTVSCAVRAVNSYSY